MTLKDILTKGYGIDFDSIRFEVLDNGLDMEAVKAQLATDEFIMDGETDLAFEVYADDPNGYVELYRDYRQMFNN